MYRTLTNRLTKHVSCCVLIMLMCLSTASLFAQDEEDFDAEAIESVATGTESESVDLDAALEETLEEEQLQSEQVGDSSLDDIPVNESKLEEIDEADVTYQDEGQDAEEQEQAETATPLSEEVEDLKKAALELNRDLLILEEELLFPANSQIVVFVSLDVGKYFALDSVKLLIDDKLIASHLYTRRQNAALTLGGIQRLYLGNLKSGEHEVTAFFVGMGPDNREYKRGATIIIDKDDDPKLLELKVRDSSANMQPEFEFEEWQL